MKHLQELVLGDSVVLKLAFSSSEWSPEVCPLNHICIYTPLRTWAKPTLSARQVGQTCFFLLDFTTANKSSKQNTQQQHQQPYSEHVGCFPGSLFISWSETQTQQFITAPKCVETFFSFSLLFFSLLPCVDLWDQNDFDFSKFAVYSRHKFDSFTPNQIAGFQESSEASLGAPLD